MPVGSNKNGGSIMDYVDIYCQNEKEKKKEE